MKAYTNYIVALFIGLLSFNTLSACVHTRQALGADFNSYFPNQDCSSCCSRIYRCFSLKKTLYFAVVGAGAGAGLIWLFTSFIGNHGMVPNTNNGRNLTTFGPSILPNGETTTFPYSMTPEEAENITKAIEGKEEWNSTTTEKLSTTTTKKPSKKPSTTTTSTTTVATTTTERLSTTTTQKPDDDVPAVKDPMVLDDDIVNYLSSNSFSKESIQNLIRKDLNVDAKRKEGRPLIIDIVLAKNQDALEFLVTHGANINAQHEVGKGTALLEAVLQEKWHMAEYLLEHDADPCISPVDHWTVLKALESNGSDEAKILLKKSYEVIEKLYPNTKKCPEEAL